jgi:hypothetical protein
MLNPPDVHGEFLPTDAYYQDGSVWPGRLEAALEKTRSLAIAFLEAAVLSDENR